MEIPDNVHKATDLKRTNQLMIPFVELLISEEFPRYEILGVKRTWRKALVSRESMQKGSITGLGNHLDSSEVPAVPLRITD